jgi:hypothetical protein
MDKNKVIRYTEWKSNRSTAKLPPSILPPHLSKSPPLIKIMKKLI